MEIQNASSTSWQGHQCYKLKSRSMETKNKKCSELFFSIYLLSYSQGTEHIGIFAIKENYWSRRGYTLFRGIYGFHISG